MSLRFIYSPILLRSIAQVLLLNHLRSQDLESGASVVSSSSDSEDGNESEIDVHPNPPKKHCSSSTSNHLRQDLESGDTTKGGKKLFPG